MKFKFYFRKSSFKKDIKNANFLLEIVKKNKPLNFLEVGVLEGATSRNICELLYKIHSNTFSYTGIDLFGEDLEANSKKEFTPISYKFSNPFKWIYFKLILNSDQGLQIRKVDSIHDAFWLFLPNISVVNYRRDKALVTV